MDIVCDPATRIPDGALPLSPADCLMVWLCAPDDLSAATFRARYHAILRDQETIAMLARWVAVAPAHLATPWAMRLAWLRAKNSMGKTI